MQNRKYAFPLEARTIVADQKANPMTLKLNSMLGVWSPASAIVLLAALCTVQGPCKQHPANEKQVQSNKEVKSYLGYKLNHQVNRIDFQT